MKKNKMNDKIESPLAGVVVVHSTPRLPPPPAPTFVYTGYVKSRHTSEATLVYKARNGMRNEISCPWALFPDKSPGPHDDERVLFEMVCTNNRLSVSRLECLSKRPKPRDKPKPADEANNHTLPTCAYVKAEVRARRRCWEESERHHPQRQELKQPTLLPPHPHPSPPPPQPPIEQPPRAPPVGHLLRSLRPHYPTRFIAHRHRRARNRNTSLRSNKEMDKERTLALRKLRMNKRSCG